VYGIRHDVSVALSATCEGVDVESAGVGQEAVGGGCNAAAGSRHLFLPVTSSNRTSLTRSASRVYGR